MQKFFESSLWRSRKVHLRDILASSGCKATGSNAVAVGIGEARSQGFGAVTEFRGSPPWQTKVSEELKLRMDSDGYCPVHEVVQTGPLVALGCRVADIPGIVETIDKWRFGLCTIRGEMRIRAMQRHSLAWRRGFQKELVLPRTDGKP